MLSTSHRRVTQPERPRPHQPWGTNEVMPAWILVTCLLRPLHEGTGEVAGIGRLQYRVAQAKQKFISSPHDPPAVHSGPAQEGDNALQCHSGSQVPSLLFSSRSKLMSHHQHSSRREGRREEVEANQFPFKEMMARPWPWLAAREGVKCSFH